LRGIFVSGVASNKKKVSARKKILDSEDEKTEDGAGGETAEQQAGQEDMETDPLPGPSGITNSQVNDSF
jgi:hypothetical protein